MMVNLVDYLSYAQASEKLYTLDRLKNNAKFYNSFEISVWWNICFGPINDETYAIDLSMVMYDEVPLYQLDVAIEDFDLQNISLDDFVSAESIAKCLEAICAQMPRNILIKIKSRVIFIGFN